MVEAKIVLESFEAERVGWRVSDENDLDRTSRVGWSTGAVAIV